MRFALLVQALGLARSRVSQMREQQLATIHELQLISL